MVYLYILALIPLGIILTISGDWVVKSASFFAKRYSVKSFLLGFFVLGIATNIPEILVAYQSIRDNVPQLTIGNLLGGSIFLLSCVMGMGALCLGRIVLDHGMTKRDIALSSAVIAAPALALWDGKMTRIEGGILLLSYIIYTVVVNREQHIVDKVEHHAKHVRHVWHGISLFIGGLIGLAISSRLFVWVAEEIAYSIGWSPFVIGLFLLTLGTNLPEMILVYRSIADKAKDIAFGDVLGSATVHTPILGIVCILAPFSVPDYLRTRVTLILLGMVVVFFYWAASTKRDINRREGLVLFLTYLAFAVFEFLNI